MTTLRSYSPETTRAEHDARDAPSSGGSGLVNGLLLSAALWVALLGALSFLWR